MASENSTGTEVIHRCLRSGCGRKLTSPESIARGYGPRCAAIEAATEGLSAKQVDKMTQVIVDKGVAATNRKGVYHVTNEADGVIRIAHVNGNCTCEWGLRRKSADTKVCYHVAAARLTAKPVIYRSRQRLAAPAPVAVPLAAPGDIWAEMDRLTAAFMAVA
jgi:Family of unknown function (DUF6011)